MNHIYERVINDIESLYRHGQGAEAEVQQAHTTLTELGVQRSLHEDPAWAGTNRYLTLNERLTRLLEKKL